LTLKTVDRPGSGAAENQAKTLGGRLVALDAYRGLIMFFMASSGFGLAKVAEHYPGSGVWAWLGQNVDHAEWIGCNFWDLIQPAFMFMVGIALPWSIANRRARGSTFGNLFGHALWRSLVLILLAVFLSSGGKQTNWMFTNVLAQIGWGYPLLFLLAFTKPRVQWIAAFGTLFVYWLVFAFYPLPAASFDWGAVGVPENWPHLTGFAAHWDKNYNFGAAFDTWFLNLFPRESPFAFNNGGYVTLNFVPSLATMIFGLLAGQLLRSARSIPEKFKWLAIAGVSGMVVGWLLGWAGICPVVKRIWTPSWAIYSGGWVALLLAFLVAIIEWRGWKKWAFPFVVIGLNPITLYCMWQLIDSWVRSILQRHLGQHVFEIAGLAWAPFLERAGVLLAFWLILFWMYRRKIFLRI